MSSLYLQRQQVLLHRVHVAPPCFYSPQWTNQTLARQSAFCTVCEFLKFSYIVGQGGVRQGVFMWCPKFQHTGPLKWEPTIQNSQKSSQPTITNYKSASNGFGHEIGATFESCQWQTGCVIQGVKHISEMEVLKLAVGWLACWQWLGGRKNPNLSTEVEPEWTEGDKH